MAPLSSFAPLAAWGDFTIKGPLAGGKRTRLYRVQINGADYVARQTTISEPALRWQQRVQNLARRAGFVVPHFIPTSAGQFSRDGWTLEPFITGLPALHSDLKRITPQIMAFHRLTRRIPVNPDTPDMASRPLNLPPNISRVCQRLFPHNAQCAIHGDLHAGNLLRLPDGKFALLDWEEPRRDHPAFDLIALSPSKHPPLHTTYEVAAGWRAEPGYTRQKARRSRHQSGLKKI